MMPDALARAIFLLAAAPRDRVDGFVRALRRQSNLDQPVSNEQAIGSLPADWRPLGRQVIELAQGETTAPGLDCIAFGLDLASRVRREAVGQQEVELVWSGPSHAQSTFRRTDRAWIDLIEDSEASIWITSYSVGAVGRIQEELLAALSRGVRVSMVFERMQDSEGQLSFNGFESFNRKILNDSILYHWPADERERSSYGNLGLMHAKALVVDGKAMFVTSANLTGAALDRNIEVGVIVRGGQQPGWLAERFEKLVEKRTIREFEP